MNLLLLEPEELRPDGTAHLDGRRAKHATQVLRAKPGETLRVGVRQGNRGTATVLRADADHLDLQITLDQPPLPRPGLDVLLAIPRPKALKKVLPALASLGVDTLVLVNAHRVEKSYFTSHVLEPATLERHLLDGLEQAQDTKLPRLLVRERFRPFVEDELTETFGDARRLLAHPHVDTSLGDLMKDAPRRTVVAIGPEGGWIPFELELLQANGFTPFSLGPRTLRVETVVPYLLGQLAACVHPHGA